MVELQENEVMREGICKLYHDYRINLTNRKSRTCNNVSKMLKSRSHWYNNNSRRTSPKTTMEKKRYIYLLYYINSRYKKLFEQNQNVINSKFLPSNDKSQNSRPKSKKVTN